MVDLVAASEPEASLGRRMEALALAPLLFLATLGVGWLIWCVLEWRNGRTPSYRLLGLRVVRKADEQPVRLARSLARSCICFLLVIPTTLICCIIGISFVFGASAPEDLLRRPRMAPWDHLTAAKVVDERTRPGVSGGVTTVVLDRIDLTDMPPAPEAHTNGRIH
jgi:hypothetical protein